VSSLYFNMQNAQVNAYTCLIYFSLGSVTNIFSLMLVRGDFLDSDALFLLYLSVGEGEKLLIIEIAF
jgi:hypothetical protein